MKKYTRKCPVCGQININLYLEESDGWMECERCKNISRDVRFHQMIRIPVMAMKSFGVGMAKA